MGFDAEKNYKDNEKRVYLPVMLHRVVLGVKFQGFFALTMRGDGTYDQTRYHQPSV